MKPINIWVQLGLGLLLVVGILALVQGGLSYWRAQASASAQEVICNVELDPAKIEQGKQVYAVHCSACHGAGLEGAASWESRAEDGSSPPPPLNQAAHASLHSDQSLVYTITHGRNAGKQYSMPSFGDTLDQGEISSVIEFIKSNWSASQLNQQDLLNQ